MSQLISVLSETAVWLLIGLFSGFVLAVVVYRNSLASITSKLIEEFSMGNIVFPYSPEQNGANKPNAPAPKKPKDPVVENNCKINGSIQDYAKIAGYTSTELEDEK